MSFGYSRIDADFCQREDPGDMDHMVELPVVLEPSLTSLSVEQRDTYTAIIDDIIAKNGGGVISGEHVLRLLRRSAGLVLSRQRHLLKMLIIQRLKLLPTPRTVTTTCTGRGYMALRVNKTASAVFDVPELLESILSHVNMADLIAARRVNKAMFRLIETSPTLQRKLFLLPGNDPPGHLGWACDGSPAQFSTPPDKLSSEVMWGSSNVVAVKNPFLATYVSEKWDCYSSPDGQDFLGPRAMLISAEIKSQISDSETWPEMYLTSLPCTGVAMAFEYIEKLRCRYTTRLLIRRSVYDPTGVTFATLWDALQKEGEVRVWGDYEPLRDECHKSERVMNTTVREQIELHERKGIKVGLYRERCTVGSYSIAVLATDREGNGAKCDDNSEWGRVQDIQ